MTRIEIILETLSHMRSRAARLRFVSELPDEELALLFATRLLCTRAS